MSIESRYRKEIDSFCDETYKVGGEEILDMAKRNMITMTAETSGRKRMTKKLLLIPIAAAVFGMTAISVAGAAGFIPSSEEVFGKYFGKYFDDETTEKLAEEGYIYTAEDYEADSAADSGADTGERMYPVMNETLCKDIFSAKIIGLAGDTQYPQMLVDITVNDEKIAADSETLGLYTLTIGTEEFEQHREDYFVEYSTAVRDETVPGLYHASVFCAPLWVTSGEEFVFDIVCIHTTEDNNGGVHEYYRDQEVTDNGVSIDELTEHGGLAEYNPDADMSVISGYNYYNKITEHFTEMQFRFKLPKDILKDAPELFFRENDLVYNMDGNPYHLCFAKFGTRETCITLDFDAASGIQPEKYNEDEDFRIEARNVAEKFTLTVDGKDHAVTIDNCYVYCDTEGNAHLCIKDRCYLCLEFPGVDLDNAKSVKLTADGTTYDLKESFSFRQ
ncbi:hypothetical protein SAMN02910447_02820 [Ruminococcus sp. YE71]|uniref:hypothetical protein n=1 Tax=unclassified Ruminococcus TaxID=2608920 RepID=UPI000885EBBE|nr:MULTISPECIES: hypothetical protein [unclassified Ruminococcus]SDA27125.1 hypothetical protein SAMN02910446_02731 [Ruminococcus sp. YE78]SFW45512.1 hypothetical protein SAMN02910447_02820 [Ruminococcus sp. YE71]